ncbi:DUF6161 domain-containing protein [Bradyrhizobium sp. JYMT SZCCT0180]|uniref:DUF6161 domain-containing protein n=1 Tax=Bradyrhizobium sp. JYMT SZCCT0180 TaxID=2807666 RepID=UPI001BA618CA|nr:DUF6161 domain-containing protein [Bradyrhizobium sp. JYMT SZCCT0180]MBR1214131.1 hypothetical protein [Bradyrhizobium sp. JYMT SZCCT0180]
MPDNSSWLINIPSQGISVSSHGKDQILQFFEREADFYRALAINNFNVVFANNSYGSVELTAPALDQLSKISQEINAGKTALLDQYIADAKAGTILVGASPTGQRIRKLKELDGNAATMVAAILSPKWLKTNHSTARDMIALFRAIAFANPTTHGFDNLIEASQATRDSKEARDLSRNSAAKLEEFITEKKQLILELESLYRTQLTIQEPAISWENIAKRKTRVWVGWLIFFGVMVVAPLVAALCFWGPVSESIIKLTSSTNGGVSISGLAAISIPALFYAWLLKNISRVFIQNLNLADDAAHRRSLALTYMGLLRDEQHPATDQDRAIILNALFRPIPPQNADEGPPVGLIELIKSK